MLKYHKLKLIFNNKKDLKKDVQAARTMAVKVKYLRLCLCTTQLRATEKERGEYRDDSVFLTDVLTLSIFPVN
jgi:hypothetical protein